MPELIASVPDQRKFGKDHGHHPFYATKDRTFRVGCSCGWSSGSEQSGLYLSFKAWFAHVKADVGDGQIFLPITLPCG